MNRIHLIENAVKAAAEKNYREANEVHSRAFRCDDHDRRLNESRFIETGIYDGKPYVHKITEEQISRRVDMSDCEDDDGSSSYFWLGDDGILHPVTFGGMERFADQYDDNAFHFAASDMIANGQVVGSVTYTDH